MDWFYIAATAILILASYIIGRSHGVMWCMCGAIDDLVARGV